MHYQWTLLRAGAFRLDGGGMFGLIPRVIWSRMVDVDDRNRIPLQTNGLLLRARETLDDAHPRTILVESGYGGKWDAKSRDIFSLEDRTVVDALAETDVTPEAIDMVILSHLHFDHAGGVTRMNDAGSPVLTFPNARVVVQQREWEDALNNKSTMTRTYLRENLEPIRDVIMCFDGRSTVAPGVTVEPMIGHTWGQQMISFNDGSGVIAFPGDVMPTINHVGLAFSMGYDMLPYDNMLSKRDLLERASTEGWRLVLDHEPGDPVVRVAKDNDRAGTFQLTPVGNEE